MDLNSFPECSVGFFQRSWRTSKTWAFTNLQRLKPRLTGCAELAQKPARSHAQELGLLLCFLSIQHIASVECTRVSSEVLQPRSGL